MTHVQLTGDKRRISLLMITFLGVIFFFGFVLQFFGVLSITLTNVLALALLCGYFLINGRFDLRLHRQTVVFAILMLLFFFIGLTNRSDALGFIVYFYYLFTVVSVLLSASLSARIGHISAPWLIRWVPIYLCLQVVLCLVQRLFPAQIVALSRTNLSIEDTVSGSYYLASDASLAFFCTLINVFMFSVGASAPRKFIVAILAMVVVFLTNSKAMQFLYVLVLSALLVWRVLEGARQARVLTYCALLLFIVPLLALFHEQLVALFDVAATTLETAYDRRMLGDSAHRLAPLGELVFGDLSWFGSGFLTYFNPVTKEWLYYSGFSLFYTIYIDCGLVGLLLVYLAFLCFAIAQSKSIFYGLLSFGILFVFSIFNFALTDISVLFVFFLLIYLGRGKVNV